MSDSPSPSSEPGPAPQTRWPEHRHANYHTYGVDDYDAYWNNQAMPEDLRSMHVRMLEEIPRFVPAGAKVLEMGPGPGHLFHALQEKKYEMYACDAAQVALDQLKAPPERMKRCNLNEGLPDFGVKFQAIVGAKVLHHIVRPDEFLKNLRDKVASGGYLMLTIPNIVSIRNRLRMLRGQFPALSPSHRNFMTPREALALMDRCGWTIKGCFPRKRSILMSLFPVLFSRELFLVGQRRDTE